MVDDINNSVLEFDSHKQSFFIHTKVLNLFSFCYILNLSPKTWFLTGLQKGLLERQARIICHDTPRWKTRKKRERWTLLPPSDQWVIKKAHSLG